MHPLNRKLLFTKARNRKKLGKSGYIVMFENARNDDGSHISACFDERSYFNVLQDQFCKTMDGIYAKRCKLWHCRRPARIAFMTFFDDPRLTEEYHGLYYHWWTTNKFKHFCFEYVALKLQ